MHIWCLRHCEYDRYDFELFNTKEKALMAAKNYCKLDFTFNSKVKIEVKQCEDESVIVRSCSGELW